MIMALGLTNISHTLIRNTLGENTKLLSVLCKSNKINRWSRYKPFQYNAAAFASVAAWRNAAKTVDYGIICPTGDNNPVTAAGKAYNYQKPTSNYRRADFRNYEHYATQPIYGMGNLDFNTLQSSERNFQWPVGQATDYNIGLRDLGYNNAHKLGDCYAALVLIKGSNVYVKTSDDTLCNAQGQPLASSITLTKQELNYHSFTNGNYTYYFVASSQKYATLGLKQSNGVFYPLPFNSTSEATGTLAISSDAGFNVQILGIGNSWSGIEDFSIYDAAYFPPSGGTYFKATNMSDFYIQVKLTNYLSQAITLVDNDWLLDGTPSLVDGITPTGFQPVNMYSNSSNTATPSVTLPANSYVIVRMRMDKLWNRANGTVSPFSSQLIETVANLTLRYKNTMNVLLAAFGLTNQ